jgi:hypothetical protein
MPIAERFIAKILYASEPNLQMSPADIYHDITKYEDEMYQAKQQIELRLKWADIVLKQTNTP